MKIYLVGGAVRDKLLGLPVKEKDWVVVGAKPEELLRLGYKQVGKEFPVFLHPKTGEEYALARMERKVAPGYAGFAFDTSPQVTLEEDLQRRDLTINAMAETVEGECIDPYHGREDLAKKVLRHVSAAFAEDPVRILRIARFAARYAKLGFEVALETNELMKKMVASGEVDALVPERVWKELERALAEQAPEVFFKVLSDCAALPVLFPLIHLDGLGMRALKRATDSKQETVVRFAALMHTFSAAEIKAFCKRYRLPVDYRDLALLVSRYGPQAWRFPQLSPQEILTFFSALDVFRREDRFKHFLQACQAMSDDFFPQAALEGAYHAVKQVAVTEWLTPELKGPEIAQKLKERRLSVLAAWCKQQITLKG